MFDIRNLPINLWSYFLVNPFSKVEPLKQREFTQSEEFKDKQDILKRILDDRNR